MKKMAMWLVKKYIIGALNDVLEQHKDDVAEVSEVITLWIKRLQIIIESLKSILARVSDGKIDDDEIDESVDDIEQIIKDWK